MPRIVISNQRITSPGQLSGWPYLNPADGIGFCGPVEVYVHDCEVDFRGLDISEMDEGCSATWGCSATFERCHIRGAGKLFLCGSGDPDKADVEDGKLVRLIDCTLEDFSRRGPEVQGGMWVLMENCTIRNWGEPSRFDTRIFGAWAHSGGKIVAIGCRFEQPQFWRGWRVMLADLCGHIGQAWNDEGVRGLLRPKNWLPGVCRGLTAGPGGRVEAYGCSKNRFWIRIENHKKS